MVGRDLPHDFEEGLLQYETEETTPLKNDEGSEREITLYGDVPQIIRDYIQNQRTAATDNEGKNPLLIIGNGRISSSRYKKLPTNGLAPAKWDYHVRMMENLLNVKQRKRIIPSSNVRVVELPITSVADTSPIKKTEVSLPELLNNIAMSLPVFKKSTMIFLTKPKNVSVLRKNSRMLMKIQTLDSIITDRAS